MSEVLLARPPTPPPSRSKEPSARSIVAATLNQADVSQTPSSTPTSHGVPSEVGSSGSGGSRKRVDFSLELHQPTIITPQSLNGKELKVVPPSRESKAAKSILKNSVQPSDPTMGNPQPAESLDDLVTMLNSVLVQLSHGHIITCIDAYAQLCRTFRILNTSAEVHLQDQIGPLLKYIRRDIQREASESKSMDISLITYALKVLMIVIYSPKLSKTLTDEYQSFLLDHAVRAFESTDTPKAIMLHCMRLIQTQNFRPRIMTPPRAAKVINGLYTVTGHVKSNGVVSERLQCYLHLMDQCKGAMKVNTGWIEHMIAGMLMPSKDTRTKAISLGLKTTQTWPSSSTMSVACQHALDRVTEKNSDVPLTLSSVACKRLRQMVKANEHGSQVPKIWGIVILLLKMRNFEVQKWAHFRDWLMVIQSCFNCSDSATRVQANLAWNRLIYVIGLNESTEASIVKILVKPVVTQLERPGTDRSGKGSRSYAASSFHILLYYGFRPSSSFKQFDTIWQAFLSDVLTEKYLSNPANSDNACCILADLFWSPRNKIWLETKAIEIVSMESGELPVIDCRWVRSRSTKIQPVFIRLFRHSTWGSRSPEDAAIGIAWGHFMRAVGDACRKEMKPSHDTLSTIATLLNSLRTIWISGPESLNASKIDDSLFLKRFTYLVQSMLMEIGPFSFSEPLFCEDGSGNILAPSSISPNTQVNSLSALEVLLRMITKRAQTLAPNEPFSNLVYIILRVFSETRSSLGTQIQLFEKYASLPIDIDDKEIKAIFWESSARIVSDILGNRLVQISRGREVPLSHQDNHIEDILSILRKFPSSHASFLRTWTELLENMFTLVAHLHGQMSWPSIVLEPLAKYLSTLDISPSFQLSAEFFRLATSSKFWAGIQSSCSLNESHIKECLSLKRFTTLMNIHLCRCYAIDALQYQEAFMSSVESCIRLLDSSKNEMLSESVQSLSESLCIWLEDAEKIFVSTTKEGKIKSAAACKLCPVIVRVAERLLERPILTDALDSLLSSGLRSTHLSTVNGTILVLRRLPKSSYNRVPPLLEQALVRLGVESHIGQAKNSVFVELEEPMSLPDTIDSQEDGLREESDAVHGPRFACQGPHAKDEHVGVKNKKALSSVQKPSAKILLPRIRHDDSQVEFVPIESSPQADAEPESQYLTDRQREVRDRQRAEPVSTFSDLVSSPIASRKRSVPSVLSLSRPHSVSKKDSPRMDEPSTPILSDPPHDFEEQLQSSPTPTPKHQTRQLCDIDIPSSPPPIFNPEFKNAHEIEDNGRSEDEAVALARSSDAFETALESVEATRTYSPSSECLPQQSEHVIEKPCDSCCEREAPDNMDVSEDNDAEPVGEVPETNSSLALEDLSEAIESPKLEISRSPADCADVNNELPEQQQDLPRSTSVAPVSDDGEKSQLQTAQATGHEGAFNLRRNEMTSDEIDDLTASQLEKELHFTTMDDVGLANAFLTTDASKNLSPTVAIRAPHCTPADNTNKADKFQETHSSSQNSSESLSSNSTPDIYDTIIVDISPQHFHPFSSHRSSIILTSGPIKHIRGRAKSIKRKFSSMSSDESESHTQTMKEVRVPKAKKNKPTEKTSTRRSLRSSKAKQETDDEMIDPPVVHSGSKRKIESTYLAQAAKQAPPKKRKETTPPTFTLSDDEAQLSEDQETSSQNDPKSKTTQELVTDHLSKALLELNEEVIKGQITLEGLKEMERLMSGIRTQTLDIIGDQGVGLA
ncbi:MAG: hypothetical protein Q9227_000647 [Pyrenula ochraceoflavens]